MLYQNFINLLLIIIIKENSEKIKPSRNCNNFNNLKKKFPLKFYLQKISFWTKRSRKFPMLLCSRHQKKKSYFSTRSSRERESFYGLEAWREVEKFIVKYNHHRTHNLTLEMIVIKRNTQEEKPKQASKQAEERRSNNIMRENE